MKVVQMADNGVVPFELTSSNIQISPSFVRKK